MSERDGRPALKPCPFCGGASRVYCNDNGNNEWIARCRNLLTCGHRGSAWLTEAEAINSWNRRAALAAPVAAPPVPSVSPAEPVAWRPNVSCSPAQHFNAGKPSAADVSYWQAQGCGIEYAYSATAQPAPAAVPAAPNSCLLDRAEALHLNTGMHWREAERLALSEIGVDDAAIVELVGECTTLGTESLLTGEEICEFARAVLVHGSGLMVSLPSEDKGAMRHLLRIAETVRAWMGDGCNPDATPKPQIAALAEFCGSTASGMLAAAPQQAPTPHAGEKL